MKELFLLLVVVLLVNEQAASAMPLASSSTGTNTQVIPTGATDCKGPIASQAHPIIGAERLAKMRREGRLPDSFVCGRCEYSLGGDPGAAYYVKTCR
jgi:hypothetical protein